MNYSRRGVMAGAAAGLAALASAGAGIAAEPVLTLRNPAISGPHGEILFSRADLEALEQSVLRTGNSFIDSVAEFRGPSAFQVVDMIGRAGANHVRLVAVNDYFVEIEIAELEKYRPVLALEMDGKPLSRRDKGPIWLMYPIDSYPELQDSVYNSRLIWQLRTIELF